jgi:cell wall-associated NlpC family hydrolase
LRLPLDDPRVLDLLTAWGVPYSWGAGIPRHGMTAWPTGARGIGGGIGWDCSGFVQAALVRLDLLPPMAPDRSAGGLFAIASPVVMGAEQLGDLAFYGISRISHVTLVIAPGVVMGANGGDSTTNADDARAYVKLEKLTYRSDMVGVRRIVSKVESA